MLASYWLFEDSLKHCQRINFGGETWWYFISEGFSGGTRNPWDLRDLRVATRELSGIRDVADPRKKHVFCTPWQHKISQRTCMYDNVSLHIFFAARTDRANPRTVFFARLCSGACWTWQTGKPLKFKSDQLKIIQAVLHWLCIHHHVLFLKSSNGFTRNQWSASCRTLPPISCHHWTTWDFISS